MRKRGETLTLVYGLEIVAGAFVALLLINAGIQYAENQPATRAFIARDLAIQLDSLYSVSGNAYISNTELISENYYSIKQAKIEVNDFENNILPKNTYYYSASGLSDVNTKLDRPEKIVISKNGDSVSIQEEIPRTIKIDCPESNTKDENWKEKTILIDPTHGGTDTGLSFEGVTEAEITMRIAQSLSSFIPNTEMTRETDRVVSVSERIEKAKDFDTIISIGVGNFDTDFNGAKAFVNFYSDKRKESVKLACKILNSLTEKSEIGAISIIPLNPEDLDTLDVKNTLQFEDKVATYIELGNINTEEGRKMMKETKEIPKLISRGITDYYEK